MADRQTLLPESGSGQQPYVRILKAVIIALIVIVTIVTIVGLAHSPLGLWITGRTECPAMDTIFVNNRDSEFFRSKASYEEANRLRRTENGLDEWDTPEGVRWTVHSEKILPFLLAEQKRDIYEPPGHAVHPGDVVLDCGANIGVFTKTALSRGAALVIAIEPAPRTLEALRLNLDADIRSGRVIVYPKGVWNTEGELELSLNPSNQGANSVVIPQTEARKVRVPLTTIDKLVQELKLSRVDFIKMDIEGAEKQAIQGASDTIKRFRPRMSLSSEHLADDFVAIPKSVVSIDARYRYKGCDCFNAGNHVKALVLAFDPL